MIDLILHVRDLAAKFKVRLIEDSGLDLEGASAMPLCRAPMAVRAALGSGKFEGIVQVPPITNEYVYAVALHELGHVIDPMGDLGHEEREAASFSERQRLKILSEEAAWAWARHYALRWSSEMDAAESYGLSTYRNAREPLLDRFERSGKVEDVSRAITEILAKLR